MTSDSPTPAPRPVPTELKRLGVDGVQITWSDGVVQKLTSQALRTKCPCAHCGELRGDISHSKPLSQPKKSLLKIVEHSTSEELRLERIWGVGNYAMGVEWGDGHNSGIYSFEYLRGL